MRRREFITVLGGAAARQRVQLALTLRLRHECLHDLRINDGLAAGNATDRICELVQVRDPLLEQVADAGRVQLLIAHRRSRVPACREAP